MRLFLFVASHTRQKQNYKNYTSAVYCRNNGKAEPAPLLSNTRNVYILDIVVFFVRLGFCKNGIYFIQTPF